MRIIFSLNFSRMCRNFTVSSYEFNDAVKLRLWLLEWDIRDRELRVWRNLTKNDSKSHLTDLFHTWTSRWANPLGLSLYKLNIRTHLLMKWMRNNLLRVFFFFLYYFRQHKLGKWFQVQNLPSHQKITIHNFGVPKHHFGSIDWVMSFFTTRYDKYSKNHFCIFVFINYTEKNFNGKFHNLDRKIGAVQFSQLSKIEFVSSNHLYFWFHQLH